MWFNNKEFPIMPYFSIPCSLFILKCLGGEDLHMNPIFWGERIFSCLFWGGDDLYMSATGGKDLQFGTLVREIQNR